MERGIITISESGIVSMPTEEVWMSMEEIADEMVAICDDRSFWREKKEAEFYQNKYNEMLWQSKFEDDEDE